MKKEEISTLLSKQKAFYLSNATLPIKFRIEALKKLYSAVKKHETEICESLCADLGKSANEAFMC